MRSSTSRSSAVVALLYVVATHRLSTKEFNYLCPLSLRDYLLESSYILSSSATIDASGTAREHH